MESCALPLTLSYPPLTSCGCLPCARRSLPIGRLRNDECLVVTFSGFSRLGSPRNLSLSSSYGLRSRSSSPSRRPFNRRTFSAFATTWGVFAYCKMPFGLTNASAVRNRAVGGLAQVVASNTHNAASEAGHPSEHDHHQPHWSVYGKALEVFQRANTFLPHVVVASTLLALTFPPSFTWFTNRYYAPALGFLMFAVGINLKASDFIQAFKRPWVIATGYMGQFVAKPLLGVLFASIAVSWLNLPQAIGSGIILVSCVSGAQLSNYATFLVEPTMAPLSIVMTALSTVTAVVVTPALTLLLLGKRLPIDVHGMIVNISQIVVAPIAAGLALNRFAVPISRKIRPFMPLLSVLVTGLCVGSPLAMNITAVRSPFGLSVLLPILGFHTTAFLLGFYSAGLIFSKAVDVEGIQKTISFETGMQSSLLGLAVANKFFADPLVGLPPAISTVLMSLMGFGLVVYWNMQKKDLGIDIRT